MPDEPNWDEIFASQPDSPRQSSGASTPAAPEPARRERRERARSERPARRTTEKRRPRWGRIVLAIVLVLAVLGGAVAGAWALFEPQIRAVLGTEEPIDYDGEGSGEVTIAIEDGDVGSDVADTLAENDVVMTSQAFYELLLEQEPAVEFQTGFYLMREKMSARAALDLLQSGENRVSAAVTIPEGVTVAAILERLAEGTDTPLEELQAAAADYGSFGLPAEAPSLEGYLFPATYEFDPGTSAHDMLQVLVDRMVQALDQAGVDPGDRHRVLTIASLLEREARLPDDFYRVSRVIQNRLADGMPLQFDSTSHYGAGNYDDSVFTSDEERADDNPYNTYVIAGLPVGPIAAAGDRAIDAALNPVEGEWRYFVTIDLDSGETVFTNTLGEHEAAVARLQEWLRENG